MPVYNEYNGDINHQQQLNIMQSVCHWKMDNGQAYKCNLENKMRENLRKKDMEKDVERRNGKETRKKGKKLGENVDRDLSS